MATPSKRHRAFVRYVTLFATVTVLVTGCSRMKDTSENFSNAIDTYYTAHPSCVFPEAVKFPVQTDASRPREISRYDSLVYQGLLQRTSDSTRAIGVSTLQVTDYDLSPKGLSLWVADANDPASGNFCYGKRKVVAIDSSTPTSSQNGATTDVVYRYSIVDATEWAKAPEVQNAFPALRADLAGNQMGRATLTDSRKGWQVTNAPWAHISDSDIYK